MIVYVINIDGKPLMPTTRLGHVRRMLKEQRAIIVGYKPFRIQLSYECPNGIQEVKLGVDAGSKHVGLSATTKTSVLFEGTISLRNDVMAKLATRKQYRHARRLQKTRYRKPRFLNRRKINKPSRIPPSIRHKIDTHLYWINRLCNMLPISYITVETAQFNNRLLMERKENPATQDAINYSSGVQLGFKNVREYILFRDNHNCRYCHGKSKDVHLQVHHIQTRKTGGNAPNNLITLCTTCHAKLHKGEISLPILRGTSYKDATFMGIMRNTLMAAINNVYGNTIQCNNTYGFITKSIRLEHKLPKFHYIDARCISGNPLAQPIMPPYIIKKLRVNNRQIHKWGILPGGIKKLNQAAKNVFGYRLMDTIKLNSSIGYIQGRRSSGYFSIVDIHGNYLSHGINYKKLKLLCHNQSYIMELDSH